MPRPSLPLRLSQTDVGATMMGKASKEDASKVKTLRLARGSPHVTSPGGSRPRPPRTPSGQGLQGSFSKIKPSDEDSKSVGHSLLQQIGITELLDQDDRPTFIIDLGNHANLEPGPLKNIFSNPALRSSHGILGLVTGQTNVNSPGLIATTAFNEFKAWATSYVRNSQALDVPLPSFSYAGITWVCSTLRKQLRLIRGVVSEGSASFGNNTPALGISGSPSMGQGNSGVADTQMRSPEFVFEEAQDYFGHTSMPRSPFEMPSRKEDNGDKYDRMPHVPTTGDGSVQTATVRQHQTLPIRGSSGSNERSFVSRPHEAILSAASAGQLDRFHVQPQFEQGFFDWTRIPISPALPRHIQFARSVDWASTALGPIEEWSSDLRSMCNLVMASPHPAAMYWGKDLIAVYNEAYILLAGEKHPQLMGQSYRVAWREIWDLVKGVFATAISTGQATMKDDDCLFIQRSSVPGYLEETYFSWSIIPLVGADGSVTGLYNPAFEKTRRKIGERRMLTLRQLGEQTNAASELKAFWGQVLKALATNEFDTPFVLIYSVSDERDSDASSIHSNNALDTKRCVLEGKLGVPYGHKAALQQLDLKTGTDFFSRVFREAMKSDKPVLLRTEDGTLDSNLLDGMEWRGFGDPCQSAIVCPIHLTGGDLILGFLVMGINPRRPYDDDYSLFVQLLNRQLSTSMAAVVLHEEEVARGRRAARLATHDRFELSEQLAARTLEAVESEIRFTRMAELAPVGIFIADRAGQIAYCNEKWYEISKVPKAGHVYDNWMDFVKSEDQGMVKTLWSNLVNKTTAFSTEFRFKASWKDPNGDVGDTWVLASAYPERNENGSLKVIFGSITDISRQKWAEHFEKRRVEEAVEMKRQQENFIDITSHEMRNPLSAILQCADDIQTTLATFQSENEPHEESLSNLLDSAIDSAATIALCANHQKRIVDDVLTLSKLDSKLLAISPCDVMPVNVAKRALKMFDGEIQTADIQLTVEIDASISELGIEWVKMDPSRLLQVMINLITNAIKFTCARDKRIITVILGATLNRPGRDGNEFAYFPTQGKYKDITKTRDWGNGEKVFIHFAVRDTGRGLTDEEKKLMFIRFSQASPRTHVQYGGSGLGLFISRELVEMQGGEIGVESVSGEGSTFAFYVKTRRSTAPIEAVDQLPTASSRKPSTSSGQRPASAPLNTPPSRSNSSQPVERNGINVLIVEDNLVNQKVLKKQLLNKGYNVLIANHGEECLDQVRKSTFWANHKPDAAVLTVVLMDLEMPVMDGLTCARKIRELEQTKEIIGHVPIIAVTANARGEQIETALQAGMVSYSGPSFPRAARPHH